MDIPPKPLIKRSFFGKGNCFKYLLYDNGVVFFHAGTEKDKNWQWKKVKMNDAELGELMRVLEGRQESARFFHSFGEGKEEQKTQIYANTKEDHKGKAFFIKINQFSKSFNVGEQRVLEAFLHHSMVRMNLSL